MSNFFDTFDDSTPEGTYMRLKEKEELIANKTAFPVLALDIRDSEWGERYVVTTRIDDEERLIAFPLGTVQSRDRLFDAMSKWLDDPTNDTPMIVIEQVGNSHIVKSAPQEPSLL